MAQKNQKTILLAEDDPFITDIYSSQLRKEGYRVEVAQDGQIALDKVREKYPDLLLLDIKLPKIDGCRLLKILRDDPKTQNVKVVVISNLNKSEFPEDISGLGVIKFLLKVESSPEDVVNAANEAINMKVQSSNVKDQS